MNYEQILALLVAKFQGTRKDGLEVLARALSQTTETIEEAQSVVDKMTPEKVASFIKDWRKSADAEIAKANTTYENGLKEKYEFVEKGKQDPKPAPQEGNLTPETVAQMIKDAVKEATAGISAQVADITGAQLTASRKAQLEAIFTEGVPEYYMKLQATLKTPLNTTRKQFLKASRAANSRKTKILTRTWPSKRRT